MDFNFDYLIVLIVKPLALSDAVFHTIFLNEQPKSNGEFSKSVHVI